MKKKRESTPSSTVTRRTNCSPPDRLRPARNHSPAPAGPSLRQTRFIGMPDAHVDLATLAEQSGTKFILALFVDLRGKPCAKLVPVEAVDLLATEGVGFAGYAVGAMGQE